MPEIILKNITKTYGGDVKAIKDVSFKLPDKSFVVFVGPSGSGKSTLLRMIAGLEDITKGELYVNNNLINNVHPRDRDIAMVFQNYALYPHLDVYENMSFGLKLRDMPSLQIEGRVLDASQRLNLNDLLNRLPKALSGGQRQRVALGRAMVRKAQIFLLDEPLSNLDAKLRTTMRLEIIKLHKYLRTNFIYVTHDQLEAMTMATHIAVLNEGKIMQFGTADKIYNEPANVFVASFIGSPQINLFNAEIKQDDSNSKIVIFNKEYLLNKNVIRKIIKDNIINKKIIIGIRPESVRLFNSNIDKISIQAKVELIENLGSKKILFLRINPEILISMEINIREKVNIGDNLNITFNQIDMYLFDRKSKNSILINRNYL